MKMSKHITLECLKLANTLVITCGLTESRRILHISDLDRNFFKDLFAAVFGQILPEDGESTAVFYRALLTCLSEMVNISLDHIDPIDVAKKDPVALYHLIELCGTYAQHLVDVNCSKDASPFMEVPTYKLDGTRKSDGVSVGQTCSSGSNSADTEALLKLGDMNKYLKNRVASELIVDIYSDQNTVEDKPIKFVECEPRVARNKPVPSDGSTWESILQPYLKQRIMHDSETKKVVRMVTDPMTADKTKSQREPVVKTKHFIQKHQVDAGGRNQSSHRRLRNKSRSKEMQLEEFLEEEFPAVDLPPDTVKLLEKKQQWQNQYIASNVGFYHTQRKLIQKQLTELEKQRKGILKSKTSELEHWNRREDEWDAATMRIKTRAALRDERTARARYNRMLRDEMAQRQRMLGKNSDDLVFRRTVDHILKSQRERLMDKKKEQLGKLQKKMTKNLEELDQLNRNYQEKVTKITSEITVTQKKDDSKTRVRQQSWKERRKRLIKDAEVTKNQLVRGARETHYRKLDEGQLKGTISKATFNLELHDTDV